MQSQTHPHCLKASLFLVVMARIGELVPLVSEPMCVKQKEFLNGKELWEKVIPSRINQSANFLSFSPVLSFGCG